MNRRNGQATLTVFFLLSLIVNHSFRPTIARAAPAASHQAQPQGALWSLATLATAGGILAACPVSGIRPLDEQSPLMRGILAATAIVVTPPYTVLKAAVAGAGAGAGCWMFLLSFDRELARATVGITGNGDWRLKAGHMTCEEPIRLLASESGSIPNRDAPMPP